MEFINFTFRGQLFAVADDVYKQDLNIVLPDGTVLGELSWKESSPPQLASWSVIQHLFSGKSADEIAKLMNGVVAFQDAQVGPTAPEPRAST